MEVNIDPAKLKNTLPYELTAGLIAVDLRLLLISYPIISLPSVIEDFLNPLNSFTALALSLTEKVLQLIFLCVFSHRWANRLRKDPKELSFASLLNILITGLVLWCLLALPPFIALRTDKSDFDFLPSLLLLGLIPGVVIGFRYWMYFLPMSFGRKPLLQSLVIAKSFVVVDKWLPLKTLVGPLGVSLLLMSLLSIPYPDGRSAALNGLIDITSGLIWLLSCYTSLAFGLLMLSEKSWYELSLDPYREARLSTIVLQSVWPLTNLLNVKAGLRMLLLSALIWFGNIIRLEFMPPSGRVEVVSAFAEEDKAFVQLKITDQGFKFRGMQPVAFSLAGGQFIESGANPSHIVCRYPNIVRVADAKNPSDNFLFSLPRQPGELTVDLEFQCSRSGAALRELEDLFLWYRKVKLDQIRFGDMN